MADNKIKDSLSDIYLSKIGDPARLVQYLARLVKDPRVPKAAKIKLAGSGLYFWVDGDLIHDGFKIIPGLGYVDDLILVVHGVQSIIADTEPAVAVELWPGDEESFRRTMTAVAWLDDKLYGNVRRVLSGFINRITGNMSAG
jgi:uncharacterized membrane protein YkvA (DUF1232 family)